MHATTIIAIAAYSFSALGFCAFALRFGLGKEWERWHAEATGQTWSELSPALQLVILSIMRATAAGCVALATTTGLLVVLLAQGNAAARWLLPVITLTFAIPAALVAARFKQQSRANPPLGPAIGGVLTPLIGLLATLL